MHSWRNIAEQLKLIKIQLPLAARAILKHGASTNTFSQKIGFLNIGILFPVPFDEDDKDDTVWFLDHDYLENMYGMFKKVNGKFRLPCMDTLLETFNFVHVRRCIHS